jgi:hypothetical protein
MIGIDLILVGAGGICCSCSVDDVQAWYEFVPHDHVSFSRGSRELV